MDTKNTQPAATALAATEEQNSNVDRTTEPATMPALPLPASTRAIRQFESRGFSSLTQVKRVDKIKTAAAYLWDAIDDTTVNANSPAGQLYARAKLMIEDASMLAVKGVSRE